MDGELGQALKSCSTTNTWAMLDAVTSKVSKKLGRKVDAKELEDLMIQAGDKELEKHGVWRTSFGPKFMPIVVINPAFGRAMMSKGNSNSTDQMVRSQSLCTCSKSSVYGDRGNHRDVVKDANRYFQSSDYNAGRHASTVSHHAGNCPMWRPSQTSHLHSWRRGWTYNDR